MVMLGGEKAEDDGKIEAILDMGYNGSLCGLR